MIDKSLRSRLEALNRAPIPAPIASIRANGEAAGGNATSAAGRFTPRPRKAPPPPPTPRIALAPGLLRGGEIVETGLGQHLRIHLPLECVWQGGTRLVATRQEYLRSQMIAANRAIEP